MPTLDAAAVPLVPPPAAPVPLLEMPTTPLLPGFAFDIVIAPVVRVGQTVPFTVTLINRATSPGDDVVVTLPLPDGVQAERDEATVGGKKGLLWQIGRVEPQQAVVLTGQVRVVRMPPGKALLLLPSATAGGLGCVGRHAGHEHAQALQLRRHDRGATRHYWRHLPPRRSGWQRERGTKG